MAVDATTGEATGPYPEPLIETFKITYVVEHEVTIQASPLAVELYHEWKRARARADDTEKYPDTQTRIFHLNDSVAHREALFTLLASKITLANGRPRIEDAELIPK